MAAFEDKSDASKMRRTFLARMQLYASIIYCDLCDAYHVPIRDFNELMKKRNDTPKAGEGHRIDPPHMRYSDTVKIIDLAAKGYSDSAIASMIGESMRVVSHHVERAQRRLYAMNRSNLIAICSAHGIIDPRTFVPDIVAKEHE